MSFFGFDTTLPRDRTHQSKAPGFSAPQDAFAAFGDDEPIEEAIDFEDTYQGFGGELDEAYDNNNLDTFGEEPATQAGVGKDFDFSGETGNVARAFEEERMRWAAQHAPSRVEPPRQATKPKRTGYEHIPQLEQLEADADLWGLKKEPEPPKAAPARKAMTLEEVEAMLAQSRTAQVPQPSTLPEPIQSQPAFSFQVGQISPQGPQRWSQGFTQPPQILQRPQQQAQQPAPTSRQQESHAYDAHHHPQILQRPRQQQQGPSPQPTPVLPTGPKHRHQHSGNQHIQPRQILQNPKRLSGHGQPMAQPHAGGHMRGASLISSEQFQKMSDGEKEQYLLEEAKRAKRNHKIFLLSKHNGLMTPQDKNFITRIQLQNLMTATGNVDAETPEEMLNEDFYYQVYNQIRGAPRQNPHQPANSFAQTYLFQTGGRFGRGRNARGAENHMQRMEQQVQRAVEAARAKPKNKQLVIEGSLGKISFSNSKTPKPLLNIKRMESESKPNTTARRASRPQDAIAERRATLRSIEKAYSCLMNMEDHVRHRPLDMGPAFDEWKAEADRQNAVLWNALKANEPFIPNSPVLHPFIAFLSHPKGKKAIPRVFRHVTPEQRTIITTMIVLNLDSLDVVHNALVTPIPAQVKEDIELFINAVVPCLYSHINDAPLSITLGLLGLILDRCEMRNIVRTKIGLIILTMLISRAELLRESHTQTSSASDQNEWRQYTSLYTTLFTALEPLLPHIFPDTNPISSDDVYVWQFLAAMGVAANAEQQQRLVLGVKDRVMSAVGAARTLPKGGERERRLGEVNLFMAALGLDVEMLA